MKPPPQSSAPPPAQSIDVGAAAGDLRAGRANPAVLAGWLPRTWHAPARFAAALYDHAGNRRPAAIRSRPQHGLDLYGDCVSVQLGAERAALIEVDAGQTRQLSFDQLHERCSALCSAWGSAGVRAGASLALVLPLGIDHAVALLSALRLGLVVTLIPPHGPRFVRTRLARVAPDHVVTTERFVALLPPGTATLSPRARGGDATLSSSYTYAPDEPALRLLSPFGDPEAAAFELSAGELHAALLRDGLLLLGLQPGDRLATPGFDPLQWQPLTLMSAWMAGASFVHCEPHELAAHPQLLQRLGVSVLGVDATLRDLLLMRGPEASAGVRSWFRSLNDVYDYTRWQQLELMLGGRGHLHFALLFNAASGGAHLFSPPSPRVEPARLWPAPGRQFVIAQPGADLLPSIDGNGVYVPLRDGEPDASLPRMVIAKLDQGWTLGGSIDPGPQARALPVLDIARSARRHPLVREACVVITPGRFSNDGHAVLLVFVADPEPGGHAAFPAAEVLQRIRDDLGEANTPERVDVFTLHPRFVDGELDRRWCCSQYQSGAFTRKARVPLFATLARLGFIFEPAVPADP